MQKAGKSFFSFSNIVVLWAFKRDICRPTQFGLFGFLSCFEYNNIEMSVILLLTTTNKLYYFSKVVNCLTKY